MSLLACSDQPAIYDPIVQPGVLIGEFGGRSFEVTATYTAAHFTLTCATAMTGPLLRSIEGGDLEASGTITTSSLATTPLVVSAHVNGDILSATVPSGTGATLSVGSFVVRRGVPGDFSGIFCAE